MRGFVTALCTLTIIPVRIRQDEDLSSSLPWFPFVGLALGVVLLTVGWAWTGAFTTAWGGGGSVLLIVMGIVLTGGLHLDGLADWADALGAYQDRESRLSIMKDSHIGAFGVLALIVVLLAKWVALERLFLSGTIFFIVPVMVISRDMMAELTATLPYARPGEGMARPFAEGASVRKRVWSHFVSICFCAFFGPAGLALLAVAWLICRAFGRSFKRGFGGITGDLLGATNEMLEAILLMICALPGGHILNYAQWKCLF